MQRPLPVQAKPATNRFWSSKTGRTRWLSRVARRASSPKEANRATVRTAVLLVDHGSRRPEANALLQQVAASFQQKTQTEIVETAHMEIMKPDLEDALRCCVERGADHVVVTPFFLAPGRHTLEDIPRMIQEAIVRNAIDISFSIAAPIGTDPLIVDILQERVRSALNGQSGETESSSKTGTV